VRPWQPPPNPVLTRVSNVAISGPKPWSGQQSMETKQHRRLLAGAGSAFRGWRYASFRLCFGRHQLSSLLPTGPAALAAVAGAVAVVGGNRQTLNRINERRLARTVTSFAENLVLKDNQSGDRNARTD